MPSQDRIALAATFLFVPADRPERFAKALASGADCVVLDLEDAVAPEAKAAARASLADAVASLGAAAAARMLVRINAPGTAWHEDDVRLCASMVPLGLAGVMPAKAESAADCRSVADALGPAAVVVPLVESLAGFDQLDAMAALPPVARLAFGHLDFQQDLGMSAGPDELELLPYRVQMVAASRRAAKAGAIDGVTVALGDGEALDRDAGRAFRLGFGGKLCIHPSQIAPVRAAFLPSDEALAWARRVLEAVEQKGSAAFALDGRMVDAPVIAKAQRVLRLRQAS